MAEDEAREARTASPAVAVRLEVIEPARVRGEKTLLRPMRPEETELAYSWATRPEVEPFWGGRGYYHSLDAFTADWRSHYFDGSSPELGRCFAIEVRDPGAEAAPLQRNLLEEHPSIRPMSEYRLEEIP